MLPTSIRGVAQQVSTPAFDVHSNPYKAKRTWPPDFSKLSEKHQFRLERRYKRRAQLKWARPRLMVATKLAQWGCGVGVLVYGVLFMDWGKGHENAFQGAREWYRQATRSIWTSTSPPHPVLKSQNQDKV